MDRATYGGEFEFNYANETPDGALVFSSKNELSPPPHHHGAGTCPRECRKPTRAATQPRLGNTIRWVGAPSRRSTAWPAFANRDLSLYLSLDDFTRRISFTYATRSSGAGGQALTFSTGYTAQGNTLVLDEPLTGNFLGNDITITAINLLALTDAPGIEACGRTFNIQQYEGTLVESGEPVALLPTLFDPAGGNFSEDFFLLRGALGAIYNNGVPVGEQVVANEIPGALQLQLYYIDRPEDPFHQYWIPHCERKRHRYFCPKRLYSHHY